MAIETPLTRVLRESGGGVRTVIYNSQGASRTHHALTVDTPGAGTHSYRVQIRRSSAGADAGLTAGTLVATVLKR